MTFLIPLIAASLALALSAGSYLAFQRRTGRQLCEKLDLAIGQHIDRLVDVRAQTLRFDASGRLDSQEWQHEIDRFLDSQLSLILSPRELTQLQPRRRHFARLVADRVAAGVARLPIYQ